MYIHGGLDYYSPIETNEDNKMQEQVDWNICVEISDEINLEIENLLDSPNEDNAACLVRSVIEKYLEKTAQ